MAEAGEQLGIVILAAGASRRLGHPKQLLELDGKPLLQHVIDAAAGSGHGQIVVVLGHGADEVRSAVRLPAGAAIVVNPNHATGQASSLRAGLAALRPSVTRALILLGDQPRVAPRAIRAVAASPGPVARASYGGEPGHPVAVDRALWGELRAVEGDLGARMVMAAHPESVHLVHLDGDAPQDVDTDDDYRRLLGRGSVPGA